MLLAYVDESGNTGEISNGGSLTYTLGCVLISAGDWPSGFDELLAMRRRLRDKWHLPMRTEVKANWLLRSSGPLRDLSLSPSQRHLIYRAHLRSIQTANARAFAVVVDKRTFRGDYFDTAWETLLQRLERTSTNEHAPLMLIHDEGENDRVRRWVRKARRHLTAGNAWGGGGSRNPARLLVDDPVPRSSQHSYFVQMADLVAYAGFRAEIPPGNAISTVCPQVMWSEIGPAIHTAVSALRPRSVPGVVLRK